LEDVANTPVEESSIYPLSIAPMMEKTNRHFRFFIRFFTRHTLLYTEMVTGEAVHYGSNERFLGFSEVEKPLVIQIGGSDPDLLAETARKAADKGYDEINFNCGCPSDKVQAGNFGASLMGNSELAAKCYAAMRKAVSNPVTVKHRIGIDDRDSYEFMKEFVSRLSSEGCSKFIVHARKAILKGLSPKKNRSIPPLRYDDVYRLKSELPNHTIEINGGITTLEDAEKHLIQTDGVMIGRSAVENPFLFSGADKKIFKKKTPSLSRHEAVEAYTDYLENRLQAGEPFSILIQPIFHLFSGIRGSRHWRQFLTEKIRIKSSGPESLVEGLKVMDRFQ